MKKVYLSLSVIVSFILFSFFGRKSGTPVVVLDPFPSPSPSPAAENLPTIPPTSAPVRPTSPPPPPPKPSGLRDGSYTGSVADAQYGNIQVKAIVSGGKITDVLFLQYPSDRQHSIEINSQAMPYLKAEAIQAQSANVDIISGATATSLAFIQSMGDALNQAK